MMTIRDENAARKKKLPVAGEVNNHNPIAGLARLVKAGVPIFRVHGDSDKVVPMKDNSAAVKSRYDALGGSMTLDIVAGGGHDLESSWFENPRLVDFLITHATGRGLDACCEPGDERI